MSRIARVRPAGVSPLEIWEAPVDGIPLWKLAGAHALEGSGPESVARALATVVARLAPLHRFEAVHVGGGPAEDAHLRAALGSAVTLPVSFDPDGRYVAERGGLHLLDAMDRRGGIIVDAGQTGLKVYTPAARHTVPHDGRDAIAVVSEAIASAAASAEPGLVLALPCELDDHGTPGACRFDGWEGNPALTGDLLFRTLARLGADHPWSGDSLRAVVLNDAELAALSAGLLHGDRSMLVLTLGFGPGAALWRC